MKYIEVESRKIELNKVYNMDCLEGLRFISDNYVDLIVTSPPYNLGISYDSYKDQISYSEYLSWVEKWLKECFRVLKCGGRICVNIPMESNLGGKKYIVNDYINLFEKNSYIKNSLVIWKKDNVTARTAWGSFKSPSCPNIIQPYEVILVYSKGSKKKDGDNKNIDITKEEFIEYSLGVWSMQPESAKRIGHPAPFPKELPYRCMKMFSYKNDIILDLFMGSGTTAVVAKTIERNFIGFEVSKTYCEMIEERLREVGELF